MMKYVNRQLYDDAGRLVLRLSVGALVFFHGFAKLGNTGAFTWIVDQLAAQSLPTVLAYGVYAGEIVAPLMILAGVYCRIGALLVLVNMIFAVVLAHGEDLFNLNQNGGWALELQGSFALGALAIALLGSGRFAVKPD